MQPSQFLSHQNNNAQHSLLNQLGHHPNQNFTNYQTTEFSNNPSPAPLGMSAGQMQSQHPKVKM